MDVKDFPPPLAGPYFSVPHETYLVNPTLGSQVCAADPNRVLLAVSVAGNAFGLSLNPGGASAHGLVVPAARGFIVVTYEQWGVMVNQAWYLSDYSLGDVSVITIDLLDDIAVGKDKVAGLRLLQPPSVPVKISTTPGVGGNAGLLDYWRKLMDKFNLHK